MQPVQSGQPEVEIEANKSRSLNLVIERNLRKMIYLRMKSMRNRGIQERIADLVTSFSGRMVFVYIHIIWFSAWILFNSSILKLKPFDPYPYGLLTMIVSLEAIFLSTFVLISQNQLSKESEHQSDLIMHISILAEHELTLALRMLDAIQDKLGIETERKDELADLETEIKPEDVLAEIERLQDLMKKTE